MPMFIRTSQNLSRRPLILITLAIILLISITQPSFIFPLAVPSQSHYQRSLEEHDPSPLSAINGQHAYISTSPFNLPYHISKMDRVDLSHLRIAVLEHAGFHEEIVGAIIKTMLDINATFTVYRDGFRYGFFDILKDSIGHNIPPEPYTNGNFTQDILNNEIDVIIHISCDYNFFNWPWNIEAGQAMKSQKEIQIICMQHELENFSDDERRYWGPVAEEDRLQFMVLSHHVHDYLKTSILKWAEMNREIAWQGVEVETFVPIFPIDPVTLPDSDRVNVSRYLPKSPLRKLPSRLAILGRIETWRRNYNPILQDMFTHIQADPAAWGYQPLSDHSEAVYIPANDPDRPPVTLHFIGSLSPSAELIIPPALKPLVHIHSDLHYVEYYRLLGSMDAVLPAFIPGQWQYLERKLSSAIPVGVLCKVPILGSELLLNSYQFLREPAIASHATGLSEFAAISLYRTGKHPWGDILSPESLPILPSPNAIPQDPKLGAPDSWLSNSGNPIDQDGPLVLQDVSPHPVRDNADIANSGRIDDEWNQYHQTLYEANADIFRKMLRRADAKIKRRQAQNRQTRTDD